MSQIVNALAIISNWLEKQNIPYMVFGGIANAVYGNPRQTFDIDIKIRLDNKNQKLRFIRGVKDVGTILPTKPVDFFQDTNVLPVAVEGIKVDLVSAELPFEKKAIQNSQLFNFQGVNIPVCRLEDFILQKVVSTRLIDWSDIETVIMLNHSSINWDYLNRNCRQLADFLDDQSLFQKIIKLQHE